MMLNKTVNMSSAEEDNWRVGRGRCAETSCKHPNVQGCLVAVVGTGQSAIGDGKGPFRELRLVADRMNPD
jgi:hypothetical protein